MFGKNANKNLSNCFVGDQNEQYPGNYSKSKEICKRTQRKYPFSGGIIYDCFVLDLGLASIFSRCIETNFFTPKRYKDFSITSTECSTFL